MPTPSAPAVHANAPAPDPLIPTPVAVTKEDWSRLELDPANFALLDPVSGGEESTVSFTREFVQVQWRVGDPVELAIIRPKGVTNPPVILYLYNYKDSLDRFKNNRLCEFLTAGGYAAVGFESSLGIDRLRSGRPMKQWFVSELQESLGASVHDVQMVLNYLENRKDLDTTHAGIFGQGSGGAIAILAAAAEPRLRAVDTLNPWGDWPDFLAQSTIIPEDERATYLTPEFLAKVKPLEPADRETKLKDGALRLQYITGNPFVPELAMQHMESVASYDTSAPHFTVTRYKDMQDLYQQNDGGKLYSWIKARLHTSGSDTPAKAAPQPRTETVPPTSGKAEPIH